MFGVCIPCHRSQIQIKVSPIEEEAYAIFNAEARSLPSRVKVRDPYRPYTTQENGKMNT